MLNFKPVNLEKCVLVDAAGQDRLETGLNLTRVLT